MEGSERSGVHNYQVQVSFLSNAPHPQPIHEMGFVQFEDHNQVLSFLAPNNAATTATAPTATMPAAFPSPHAHLVSSRPSWSNEQVGDPKIPFQKIT